MTEQERLNYRNHVETLSNFEHRGSATENERRAASYLMHELIRIGITAKSMPFKGSNSWGCRHLTHVVISILGLLFLCISPVATLFLGSAALLSFWAEGETRGIC